MMKLLNFISSSTKSLETATDTLKTDFWPWVKLHSFKNCWPRVRMLRCLWRKRRVFWNSNLSKIWKKEIMRVKCSCSASQSLWQDGSATSPTSTSIMSTNLDSSKRRNFSLFIRSSFVSSWNIRAKKMKCSMRQHKASKISSWIPNTTLAS